MKKLGLAAYKLVVLFLLSFCTAAAPLRGQAPTVVSYQGQLTDADGSLLDGTFSIRFAIYSSAVGGTHLWQETQLVEVQDGLFSVLLGSVTPIQHTVFSDGERFLGITVGTDPEMIPRRRIASSPFAQRVVTVEGAKGGNITGPLTVSSNIAAGDSLLGVNCRLGSPTKTGRIRLFGAGSSNPIATFGAVATGGGELILYDPSAGLSVALSRDVSDNYGGFLQVNRSGSAQPALVVDGNYAGTRSPRIYMMGSSTEVVFDLTTSSDASIQFPIGAINALEMFNEPGLSTMIHSSSTVYLDGNVKTVASRSITCPTSGWVVAIATAALSVDHTEGTSELINLAVSNQAGSIPSSQNFTKIIPSNWGSTSYQDIVTVHGSFAASQGSNTFYLLGQKMSGGTVSIRDVHLTMLFVPTWYGPTSSEEKNFPPGSSEPADAALQEFDAHVARIVREQMATYQEQLERRIRELEQTLEEQAAELPR